MIKNKVHQKKNYKIVHVMHENHSVVDAIKSRGNRLR